jgi:hypothetical protein
LAVPAKKQQFMRNNEFSRKFQVFPKLANIFGKKRMAPFTETCDWPELIAFSATKQVYPE